MKIFVSDSTYRFGNNVTLQDKLEPGNYALHHNQNSGEFFLQTTAPFVLPSKIYGKVEEDANFYMNSFEKAKANLGILLNGEKGSGKTLLATMLCIKMGLPVIIIDGRFGGQGFVKFINEIDQPCVVLIDEFDKYYTGDYEDTLTGSMVHSQTELLKIMDSKSSSKKLFIFTSNEDNLSEYMKNRPSRIRYKQTYGKMDDDTVREVLTDKLSPEYHKFIDEFMEINTLLFGMNLDTLLTLIDEVNMLGLGPKVVIKRMNIIPESENFNVKLLQNGKEYESWNYPYFNPLDPEQDFMPDLNFTEKVDGKDGAFEYKSIRRVSYVRKAEFKVIPSKQGLLFEHESKKYSILFEKSKYKAYTF